MFIPTEIFIEIISYCEVPEIICILRSSRYIRQLVSDNVSKIHIFDGIAKRCGDTNHFILKGVPAQRPEIKEGVQGETLVSLVQHARFGDALALVISTDSTIEAVYPQSLDWIANLLDYSKIYAKLILRGYIRDEQVRRMNIFETVEIIHPGGRCFSSDVSHYMEATTLRAKTVTCSAIMYDYESYNNITLKLHGVKHVGKMGPPVWERSGRGPGYTPFIVEFHDTALASPEIDFREEEYYVDEVHSYNVRIPHDKFPYSKVYYISKTGRKYPAAMVNHAVFADEYEDEISVFDDLRAKYESKK